MDLAQSSSAAGVSDRAIPHGTESNMAAACGNRWLVASWELALQALDGLNFVFLDRTAAPTWLAITWALVFELVETWLCPFRFTWLLGGSHHHNWGWGHHHLLNIFLS